MNKKVTKSNLERRISNMYIGMDLHKKYLQIAVFDEKGKVLRNSKICNGQFYHSRTTKSENLAFRCSIWLMKKVS